MQGNFIDVSISSFSLYLFLYLSIISFTICDGRMETEYERIRLMNSAQVLRDVEVAWQGEYFWIRKS